MQSATRMLTGLLGEFSSNLYALGASTEVWRHWTSLTAFGLYLSCNIQRAANYAALGGEWAFIKALPNKPFNTLQTGDLVAWSIVSGNPLPQIDLPDQFDNVWFNLAHGIIKQNHSTTEESLKGIADFWMEETGGAWKTFLYGRYPVFETPICAVAAVARRNGFTPTSLTKDQSNFLEPGLAIREPDPMFPSMFSIT